MKDQKIRNKLSTLCRGPHQRGVLSSLSHEQFTCLVELLLTGFEEQYTAAWKLFYGFGTEAQSLDAVSHELGITYPITRTRVDNINASLASWARQRILKRALEDEIFVYEGNARPLVFLGLTSRAKNALSAEGFFSIQDLVDNVREFQLRFKTPNLGKISAEQIIEVLAREGVTLRSE